MFGKSKKQSSSSVLALPEFASVTNTRKRGGYDRRATGISVDFVYQPESFAQEMVAGGYGEPVDINQSMGAILAGYPSEDFLGLCIIGTDAGRYLGKRLVNHFENYGFGHGYCFDVTKVIGVIPLKGAGGLGACPGNSVIISPSGWANDLDTLYHEYCHNIGWDHEYEIPGDNRSRQLNKHKDPIYIDAAKAAAHLCQFGEA